MAIILIGSRALALRAPNLLIRKPNDFDFFISSMEEFKLWMSLNENKIQPKKVYQKNDHKMIIEGNVNCEFEIIQTGTSSKLFEQLVENDSGSRLISTTFGMLPSLDLLFTLKSSHKYLKNSPHFWKNLVDYHVMKTFGAKVRPEFKEFLKLREKETYSYKHPSLNVDKKSFFTDEVKYMYDHDTIHQSVAIFEKPAYLHYIKNGQEVQCDKNKFFACSKDIQMAGVIEEAAVLAIERSLVPFPGVKTPQEAWKFALSKVCSSITSGFFRQFAYENALDILKLCPKNYWEKFQRDVELGLVKRMVP